MKKVAAVGTRCADHVTPLYPQKLALTSPTGGGRSVGIVRVRTKATEFFFYKGQGCSNNLSWPPGLYTLVFIPKLYLKCSYVGTSCRPGSFVRCSVTDKCPSMYCLYCLYLTSFYKQRMCYVQSWGKGRP